MSDFEKIKPSEFSLILDNTLTFDVNDKNNLILADKVEEGFDIKIEIKQFHDMQARFVFNIKGSDKTFKDYTKCIEYLYFFLIYILWQESFGILIKTGYF